MAKKKFKKLKDIDSDSDQEEIESDQLNLLNDILHVKHKNPTAYSTIKYVMYATAIFIVLSLPFTDRLFELALPIANSWLFLLGIKAAAFFVLFYIILCVTAPKK